MRTLFALVLSLAVSCSLKAVAYEGVATGNWDSNSSWSPNTGHPGTGDTANIDGGVTITVATGTSAASSSIVLGQTNGTSGLIINGTLTVDSGASFKVGQGASKEGLLTLGPGGILNMTNASLYLNNCTVNSTATANSRFNFTGSGAIETTGVSGPKQDINVSYVNFRQTGSNGINFTCQNTTGSATNRLIFDHCLFVSTAAINFGTATTPNTCAISVTNCDFREIGGTHIITISRVDSGVATYVFQHNTYDNTVAAFALAPTTSTGLLVDGNVLINMRTAAASTSGNMTISNNLMTQMASAANVILLSDAGTADTVTYNYFVETADNLHPIATSGTGGSGSHAISYNIMDGIVDGGTYTDRPDMFLPGLTPLGFTLNNNLILQTGNFATGVTHPVFTAASIIKNNTLSGNISSGLSVSGVLYQPEGAANVGGSNLSLRSNLGASNGNAGDNFVQGASSGVTAQTVGYSDYNSIYNYATPYAASSAGLTVSSGNSGSPPSVPGSHDVATAPNFFDPRRNLAVWNGIFGSGTATSAAGIAYFLGLNGYRGTPNFDQNGTATAYTVRNMIDWVSYGYSPTTLSLRGSGDPTDSSPDVGAISVRSKTTPFFF